MCLSRPIQSPKKASIQARLRLYLDTAQPWMAQKYCVAPDIKPCFEKCVSIGRAAADTITTMEKAPRHLSFPLQSLSDIVTTLGTRQNSHNIQSLSQGDKLSLCPVRKLRVKLVTMSDFCHKVIVTISDKDCIDALQNQALHCYFLCE